MSEANTTTRSSLEELLASGVTLPPLPDVGLRLLQMAREPLNKLDVHKLANLIDTDPAMALRILKVANSSYFNPINEVKSLGQALMLIGPREAIQTLCYLVLNKSLPPCEDLKHFSFENFWTHSWACAMAARILCHPSNGFRVLPGELYLAGLLHGVGKLVLAQKMPEDFDRCLENAMETGVPLYIVERNILGFTDAELAERLLESWGIPESVRGVIGNYQFPGAAPPELRQRASLLQFAIILTNMAGIGSLGVTGETDIEKSRLVQEGTSPLARPHVRDVVIAEIMETFNKKCAGVLGDGATPDSPKGIEIARPPVSDPRRQSRQRSQPAKKQKSGRGLFGRARKAFSSLVK